MKHRAILTLLAATAVLAGCGGTRHQAASPHNCRASYGPSVHQPGVGCPPANATVIKAQAAKLAPRSLLVPHATGNATIEQFDTVTISTLPSWARAVAGYVDGSWPTYYQEKGRWPIVIGISVSSSAGADCIDLEPGNPGPSTAGPWVRWQLTQGNTRPCVYSMLSWMPAIEQNLAAYGISRSQVRLWDADWTYHAGVDSGFDCTQWTDHALNSNLDESTCQASFYSQPAQPKPKPVEKCLRKPYPQSVGCGRVRYGYTVTVRDIAKLHSRLKQHHCTARRHPSYCSGWRHALRRDQANISTFQRLYA